MYTLKLKHHFDAAHHLKNYKGACANLHGHRWIVEVEIIQDELKNDMVIDFKKLKSIIDELDHCCLNKKVRFNPTAENLSRYLHNKIVGLLDELAVVTVTLWETPDASITYSND